MIREPGTSPLRVVYCCGALRVTTRVTSTSTGPRAHVVGMIAGMRSLGLEVEPLLVGDQLPAPAARWGEAPGAMASRSWRGYAADGARLLLNPLAGGWVRRGARLGDVVYERQATYQALGLYRRRGVPWVVESNGPFWYEASQERKALSFPGLARTMELAAYKRADLVVAVSEALKQVLVDHAGLAHDRVLVVPNAVDPTRFPDHASGPPGPGLTVGFVGYMIAWAGLHNLLDATARARARGVDVRLLLVGDGPARQELQEGAAALGLGESVRFVGHQSWSVVPSLLAQCHVAFSGQVPMAIGSMYHSPLKLYEYAAAGLPVVATDFPDARQLVHGAGAGWLVDPGDVEGIVAALGEAASAPEALARARRAVRSYVVAHHTWRQRAQDVMRELDRRALLPDHPHEEW